MTEERFYELCAYERQLEKEGYKIIGGIDEAGRGPLAGPVVAGCVIYPANGPFSYADDSKKLSEKRREAIFDDIKEKSLGWGVGFADNCLIDEINILQATFYAMREAVKNACEMAGLKPEIAMIDHVHIPDFDSNIKQLSITHGDALSVTIGAASILAKVTRDRYMVEMAEKYPGYGFEKHKGYGTKAHYEAIRNLGISDIHRKSFLKKVH